METLDTPMGDMSLESAARQHLLGSGKWAKFLAIIGFIIIGLIVIVALFAGYFLSNLSASMGGMGGGSTVMITAVYLILAVVMFFPTLYLLHFSNHAIQASTMGNVASLTAALFNLKRCFRFIGVLYIIYLSLVVLFLLLAIVGGNIF
ncbi:MAG: hypothetical protein SH856_11425 [Flavobacteriales bacterium]|nr:hypothetical protein [Flavobacteriales bacterium]